MRWRIITLRRYPEHQGNGIRRVIRVKRNLFRVGPFVRDKFIDAAGQGEIQAENGHRGRGVLPVFHGLFIHCCRYRYFDLWFVDDEHLRWNHMQGSFFAKEVSRRKS